MQNYRQHRAVLACLSGPVSEVEPQRTWSIWQTTRGFTQMFLWPSSELWSQHGRRWNPDGLCGSGCVEVCRALTFNLYIVTWPRGHRRINYIYKTLLCFLLASTCIKQTSNTTQTQKHGNIQQEVSSGLQNNNNIHNILFSLSKHFVQKVFIETEILNHWGEDDKNN